MNRLLAFAFAAWVVLAVGDLDAGGLPVEPVEIGATPQFFVDDYIVDNRFAIKYKNNQFTHRFHPPQKDSRNPLLAGDGGFVNVVYDERDKIFRMWYQTHDWTAKLAETGKTEYAIAYAESADGFDWKRPNLNLFSWKGSRENNIVFRGIKQTRASGPQILLSLPHEQLRGYRYLMSYRVGGSGKETDGIRLVGSHDGIHWDPASDMRIKHLHSDTLNSIVYDTNRREYVMFCRAKHLYRTFSGEIIDTGESRRIARVSSPDLWSEWEADPQQLLIPDQTDAANGYNCFYGMPTHYHAGIYWGFLWVFRMNDPIYTELVTSRDGIHWDRQPGHVPFIPRGAEGEWDDGLVFGGPHWVEVGDEWRFYYAGSDDGHQSRNRETSIGVATARKERLVSLYGPSNGGGAVITRKLLWPGGDLLLNVAAPQGEVRVRVSDANRKPLEGFDYDDCETFTGDSISRRVTWKEREMRELKGQVVRLEIFLRDADLFTFRATAE